MTLLRLIPAVLAIAVLWSSAAQAQGCGPSNPNCIVPTAPNGTNTNQAASTAFVQNAFAGGSLPALPNTQVFIGGLDGLAHAQALSGTGDCTMSLANNGVATFICTKTNGVNFGAFATGTSATNLTGNLAIARFNGGAGANPSTFWAGDGTWKAAGSVNASQFGITCDGVTDDGPAFMTAFNTLAGAPLVLPAGTCRIATQAFYNTSTTTLGILTVPGVNIIGQGRDVTKIETDVSGGYAVAINSAWASLHKSMFLLTPLTTGSLATNTYWVQTTVTDPNTNEVNVSPARSVAVTGPSGSIQLTLAAINPGYTYNIYIGTTSTPANYATVSGSNAVGLAGNQTVTITAIGGAHAVPTSRVAIWQVAGMSNLSITNTNATANASGVLWFRVGYSTMSNVYMKGLTGNGLDMPNWTGDNDGSFVVTVDKSKFDTIAGWCIMAAGNTLEFSNFTVSDSVFNLCGLTPANTLTPVTMTAITNANPGVVTTASAHSLLFGDQIFITGVAGMSLTPAHYRACGTVSGSTFSLCDLNGNNVNTTSLGAYTASSGNERLAWRPPQMQANGNGPTLSGAIAWTGLIGSFINNGFTQNNNVSMYFSEAGSSDGITIRSTDWENTAGKGLYAASAVGMSITNGECLSTSSLGNTLSCVQLGTGLTKGTVQNVQINNLKVRTDAGLANGFEIFGGAGGLINPWSISANNVFWQSFAGVSKYVGFLGNPQSLFWARFDGKTGATCTLKSSFNIASCVRTAGPPISYTLTFSTPFLDANYAISGSASNTGVSIGLIDVVAASDITTTTVKFLCVNSSVVAQDCDIVSVQGFGNPN